VEFPSAGLFADRGNRQGKMPVLWCGLFFKELKDLFLMAINRMMRYRIVGVLMVLNGFHGHLSNIRFN